MRRFCDASRFSGLYIETLLGTVPENDYRIVIDGSARGLTLDLSYYKSTRGIAAGAPANRGMRLLKATAGATLLGARLYNGAIWRWDSAGAPAYTPVDDIDLAADSQELVIDNVMSRVTDGNIYDNAAGLSFSRAGVATVQPGVTWVNGPVGGSRFRLVPQAKASILNVQDGLIVLDTDGHYYARRAGGWDLLG